MQNDVRNRDLDSASRVMGTLNIFKIFAVRKNLMTSIVTAFVEEKNKELLMAENSLLLGQQTLMTTGPMSLGTHSVLQNQALCGDIHGKEFLPVTVTPGNYDFIWKQEKEKWKIYGNTLKLYPNSVYAKLSKFLASKFY